MKGFGKMSLLLARNSQLKGNKNKKIGKLKKILLKKIAYVRFKNLSFYEHWLNTEVIKGISEASVFVSHFFCTAQQTVQLFCTSLLADRWTLKNAVESIVW